MGEGGGGEGERQGVPLEFHQWRVREQLGVSGPSLQHGDRTDVVRLVWSVFLPSVSIEVQLFSSHAEL